MYNTKTADMGRWENETNRKNKVYKQKVYNEKSEHKKRQNTHINTIAEFPVMIVDVSLSLIALLVLIF